MDRVFYEDMSDNQANKANSLSDINKIQQMTDAHNKVISVNKQLCKPSQVKNKPARYVWRRKISTFVCKRKPSEISLLTISDSSCKNYWDFILRLPTRFLGSAVKPSKVNSESATWQMGEFTF